MRSSQDPEQILAEFDETLDTADAQLDQATAFLNALGYEDEGLTFDKTYPVEIEPRSDPLSFPEPEDHVTVHIVVQLEDTRDPYLVVNLRYTESDYHAHGNRGELTRIDENMARDLRNITNSQLAAILTNHSITIDDGSGTSGNFQPLNQENHSTIAKKLERPET